MASLGTASLHLTTNNSGLNAGLGKAERDVRGFGSKLGGGLMAAGKLGAAGLVAGIGAGLGMGLVKVAGDVISRGMERLPEIAKVGELAKSFQTPIEQFTALQGVAAASGSDARDFQEALITLGKAGQDAATGTGEAAAMFKRLGIDVNQFNQLNAVDKFYALNDALKGLDATTKGAAMGKLLGEDSMKNLTGLMNKSSDEIRRMGEAYKMTGGDVAKAQLASESMAAAQTAVGRAFDAVLIALAPVFQFLGDLIPLALEELQGMFGGMGDHVVPVLKAVIVNLGYVWDTLKVGVGVAGIVAGRIVESFGVILDTLGMVISLAADQLPESMKPDWVNGLSDGISAAGKKVEAFGQKLGDWGTDTGAEAWNNFGKSADQIDKFFTKFDERRRNEIKRRSGELSNPNVGRGRDQGGTGIDLSKTEAALRGSKEAANIELQARFRASQTDNEQQKQTMLAEQTLEVLKEMLGKEASKITLGII